MQSFACIRRTSEASAPEFNMNREPADTNWNKNVIGEKDPEWLKRAEDKLLITSALFADFHVSTC